MWIKRQSEREHKYSTIQQGLKCVSATSSTHTSETQHLKRACMMVMDACDTPISTWEKVPNDEHLQR